MPAHRTGQDVHQDRTRITMLVVASLSAAVNTAASAKAASLQSPCPAPQPYATPHGEARGARRGVIHMRTAPKASKSVQETVRGREASAHRRRTTVGEQRREGGYPNTQQGGWGRARAAPLAAFHPIRESPFKAAAVQLCRPGAAVHVRSSLQPPSCGWALDRAKPSRAPLSASPGHPSSLQPGHLRVMPRQKHAKERTVRHSSCHNVWCTHIDVVVAV